MELTPSAASYRPGEAVMVQLAAAAPSDSSITVYSLGRTERIVPVVQGDRRVDLGSFEVGGYGVELEGSTTAFDVLASPFDRPRYGFVAALDEQVDIAGVTSNFRRLHLNLAQFYDWAYRHSTLLPPEDRYLDPLGQERTLSTVNAMAEALSAVGTAPLGYSAVYAVGHDELDTWGASVIHRSDGEAYRLGENFLVLVDPAEPRWLEHYLGQLEAVLETTKLSGFHLDQYGWPKFAQREDGTVVDLAESFVTLLAAIRERMPAVAMMFNNVNDFPTWATATSPQDASYIEVWPPHSGLQDLADLASRTRALRPEHPPILSAYLSCYNDDERRANTAAELVMATAFSHGASHLLLGEHSSVLTGPYYPDNHVLTEQSLSGFVPWYDFAVRYGDLLYDPKLVDVTETYTGGINGDVVFSGLPVSTKADAGTIWTRVVRTGEGLVLHLINLTDQASTEWDEGKNDLTVVSGLTVTLSLVGSDAVLGFASVEEPTMVDLVSHATSASEQHDALSAAQAGAVFAVPPFRAWAVVLVPLS
ncbi:MAG: hypothetical protein LCH43_04855 [Actinobacteria bacterium]|nr:hypothetical protein [Actinomycetota bacterium]